VGEYAFNESAPAEGQGVNMLVEHSLRVYPSGDTLLADLSADGFLVSIHAKCLAYGNKNELHVVFSEQTDATASDRYDEGDTLFTLKAGQGKVLTYWKQMQPQRGEAKNGAEYYVRK
jgi:hypothetical protein